ncbi:MULTISPECIES: hypothetical protein [Microbacterium]|nr:MULTISPECIES: hypothetical protein [unclassified Microbacterium]
MSDPTVSASEPAEIAPDDAEWQLEGDESLGDADDQARNGEVTA